MAGNTGAEKYIGKLMLDISDVKKQIDEVNAWLGKIGANINLEDTLSKKVSAALQKLVDEAKKAGTEVEKAMQESAKTGVNTDELKKATQAWKEYYELMAKSQRAANSGQTNLAEFYEREAKAIIENVQALREQAEATKTVQKAMQGYQAARQAGVDKAEAAARRDAAKAAREEAKAQQELQKEIDASNKAKQKAQQLIDNQKAAEERDAIEAMVTLLKRKADMETQATKAVAAGNVDNANLYLEQVKQIEALIAALDKLFPGLEKEARLNDEVAQAELRRQAAVNTAKQKSEQINYKDQEAAVKAYADALVALYNKQAEINNLMASGKLKEGTQEYEDAMAALERCGNRAKEAGEKLAGMGVDANSAVEGMARVEEAAEKLVASEDRLAVADTSGHLTKAKQLYIDLTDAIKNYNAEKQKGNELGMNTQQARIDGIMTEVGILQQAVQQSNLEADAKQNILNIIQQCTTAENQHLASINKSVGATGELESQVTGLVTRYLSLMAVIRMISSLIQNTVEYVTAYSDKMNEIQMITLKTDEEVAGLAETYRDLAEMMNVSSLDMADAAIYFTRQGLSAAEIEKRLKNVTMYAKAANVEFKDASEIITAVVNSMGLAEQEMEDGRNAAQRVADVFLKVGDSAATSGQEIGEAMQKAAASAGAFGMSFEWLASYIATVSETTRQEARTIGTALNTIIARLHQIKQQGYNSEDETKINDVQKALAKIGVTLMDNNNEWRDMDTIFQEIGAQWDTLDGKTKSYIATTMAGVKQQNVFLALMNDLGKENAETTEHESRAWELYAKAIDSAGTAEEKYAVYKDSVAASQERLNVAQEKFYALLDSSVIKNWNDMLAGLITNITHGAEAWGSWNIILPAVASGILMVVTALKLTKAHAAGIENLFTNHPIVTAIGAAAAALFVLVEAFSSVANATAVARGKFNEANEALSEINKNVEQAKVMSNGLATMYEETGGKVRLTTADLEKYSSTLEEIEKISPEAKKTVEAFRDGAIDQRTAVEKLNEELEKYVKNEQIISGLNLVKKYNNYQGSDNSAGAFTSGYNNWSEGWFGGKTGSEGFANALKHAYEETLTWDTWQSALDLVTGKINVNSGKYMTQEIFDKIRDMVENDVDWSVIGGVIWRDMFSGDNSYDVNSAIKAEVNAMVDEVVNTASMTMSEFDGSAVREKLVSMLFDADGNMRNDLNESGKIVADFVNQMLNAGFDASQLMSPYERLMGFAGNLFGKLSSDMVTQIAQISNNNPKIVDAIADAYNQLIAMGFSKVDIAEIMKNANVYDWADATNLMIDHIKQSILKKTGYKQLGELVEDDEGNETWDEGLWGELDIETLKLIDSLVDAGVNLRDIQNVMDDSGSVDEFSSKISDLAKELGAELPEEGDKATKSLKDLIKDIKTYKSEMSSLDKLYDKAVKNGKVTLDDVLGSGLVDDYPELLMIYDNVDNLIAKIKELRELNVGKIAQTVSDIMWNSESEAKRSPFAEQIAEAGLTTLKEYRDMLEQSGADFSEVDEYVNNSAEAIKEAAEKTEEAAETWLAAQAKIAETTDQVNWAKSNGFIDQVNELQGTIETNGVEAALDVWNGFTEEMRKAIANEYPNLIRALNEVDQEIKKDSSSAEAATKAQKNLNAELKNSSRYANAKNFKEIYEATKKLSEGTISAKDAYTAFNKEADKVTKAYEDILDVQNKLDYNAKEINKDNQQSIDASDVSNLASMLNMTADQILADFPAAVAMFDELTSSTGDFTQALNALNEAAFIRITGTSEADFSEIKDGLISVQNMAQETVNMLLATGQWTIDTVPLNTEAWVQQKDGSWNLEKLTSVTQILKPTGSNPFGRNSSVAQKRDTTQKKNRSSGGGGGTKNNKSNEHPQTEVELMLNRMAQVQAIMESQQAFYQSQSKYYNQTGQLQGVIGYSRKEIEVLTAQNKVLQQNIDQIDEYRRKKEAELATLNVSDDKYEEVRDDLERLQKAHQEYTRQVIDNKTAIDQLNETIKDTQKKIRDMQIKIREQIYKAIEDREKKAKNMLQNEISMENTILDIIKRKYEIERDRIISNTESRITALQEERDLLSEQLQIRKEMQEAEDKAAKLAQLEVQYQRIMADPTRRKEAQKIKDQIDDLRNEIAWEEAENEVKAQQASIDQQTESLEDYKQYIEEYYEDLFEHPQKLIEEMRDIITRTDDEIMAWLEQNSEEYANATENTQQQMRDTWSDTLDEMRGRIRTYWDEVEEIIAGGDDNIVQFLIDNSEDYAKAGRLQAEKYVEEWRDELEDLHKALEEAFTIDAPNYSVLEPSQGSGSGGSSGGGGGGSSGGNQKTQKETQKEDHGYSFVYKNKRYADTGYVSKRQAQNGADNHIDRLRSGATKAEADRWESLARDTLYVYKNGGIADFTGPAWLDGSMRNPERVLSPYQTKLFESMVQALERMSTITVPTMPNFGKMDMTGGGSVSVGDIIVNVDNLDTDADYEELADKVSDVLMERIGRTAFVGGLRING